MPFPIMIFFIAVIIFSAIVHEYAHGWVADYLGDPTARYAGRLTLNPRAHIDPIGSILLPILLIPTGFLFAYAKPVPYNPYNLKNQKWGPVYVAIAGPLSNFALAFLFGLLIKLSLLPPEMLGFIAIIVWANILLGVFNLIPIPPLDGSKLLYAILPDSQFKLKMQLERYGFMILLAFIFLGGFSFFFPIMKYLLVFFTGGASLF